MWQIKNNLAYSELLSQTGITHFTTTKPAGNMSDETQRNKILSSQGINPAFFTSSKQVHDNKIKIVQTVADAQKYEGFDGFFTELKGIPMGIFTADCVPVFLAEKTGRFTAILHAGWKGLYNRIVENGVETLLKNNIKAENIFAGIGPHICEKCYQVGKEFAEYFPNSYKNGYMNLSNEIILRLKSKTIPKQNIDCAPSQTFCTFHNNNMFFSYRKGEQYSRMLSLVIL